MARLLITSGPTRQYLDPVRYITNCSSGLMGAALAQAALELGHQVTILTGPVNICYPDAASVIEVLSTDEMLSHAVAQFPDFDGVIGAAAPCDYKPSQVSQEKLVKDGSGINLELFETPDVIATLGQSKLDHQWVVGFALETDDHRFRATTKAQQKCCDLIVLNGVTALNSTMTSIHILTQQGECVLRAHGTKQDVSHEILSVVQRRLIDFDGEEGP